MQKSSNTFKIFYSWLSDLEDNTRFIRAKLREAANLIEKSNNEYTIKLDEATRDVAGSPDVKDEILRKIEMADIFICDISIINKDCTPIRKTPNPNVAFELGYAVAHLGWNRIIILFNTDYGSLDNDVPFDFKTNRISKFTKASDLKGLLKVAIETIINENPDRPTGKLSPEEIKRQRDIKNLEWILSTIHLPTLQQHILDCPRMIQSKVFCYFWEDFRGVAETGLFHLYDSELAEAFNSLYQSFKETLSYLEYYHSDANGYFYILSNPLDAPLNATQEKVWDFVLSASQEMRIALEKILTIVRERFLEVDISNTNRIAWNNYIKFKNENTI